MLRRKDRIQFPEQQILYLLRKLKTEGQVSIHFESPQVASKFRFMLYAWRNLQRAAEYQGLEPELAATAETFVVSVDGPILKLHGDRWDWLDQAIVNGKPLREWLREEVKEP